MYSSELLLFVSDVFVFLSMVLFKKHFMGRHSYVPSSNSTFELSR